MNLDLAFAKRLLTDPAAMNLVKESGFNREMLFDEGQRVVDFAMTFFQEHGKLPAIETIEGKVGVSLTGDPPEPIEFYVGELVKRWKGNKVGEGLRAAVRALEKGNPDESLSLVMDLAAKVKAVGAGDGNALIDLTDPKVIKKRISEYQRLRALGGQMDGIPTPWETINKATQGIHDDELWIVIGRLKSGKTWAEIVMAQYAWKMGQEKALKVLLVSEEMGIWKIARRWDAVHAQLPYGDFKRGQLATPVETRWMQALDDLKGKSPFWIAGKQRVQTVEELEIAIEELKPDITFVDGAYFLDANKSKDASKWERTSGVVDRLQAIPQRKHKPLVISWQFNRKKVKTGSTEGHAEDVAFAYEVMQDADVVLGIFRDEDLERKKQAIIRMVESRESERVNPLLVEYDFDTMSFREIGEIRDDEVSSGGQAAEDIKY